jgi:hypothetical protein
MTDLALMLGAGQIVRGRADLLPTAYATFAWGTPLS